MLEPNAYSQSGLTPGTKLFQAQVWSERPISPSQHNVAIVREPNNTLRTFCDCKDAWVRFGNSNYQCKHVIEVIEYLVAELEAA